MDRQKVVSLHVVHRWVVAEDSRISKGDKVREVSVMFRALSLWAFPLPLSLSKWEGHSKWSQGCHMLTTLPAFSEKSYFILALVLQMRNKLSRHKWNRWTRLWAPVCHLLSMTSNAENVSSDPQWQHPEWQPFLTQYSLHHIAQWIFTTVKRPPVWVDLQAQAQWIDSISAINVKWFGEWWPSFLAHTALNHGTWPRDKSAS